MVAEEKNVNDQVAAEEKDKVDFDLEIDDISFTKDLKTLLEEKKKD